MFNKVLFDLSGTRNYFHSEIICNILRLGGKVCIYTVYKAFFWKKKKKLALPIKQKYICVNFAPKHLKQLFHIDQLLLF